MIKCLEADIADVANLSGGRCEYEREWLFFLNEISWLLIPRNRTGGTKMNGWIFGQSYWKIS